MPSREPIPSADPLRTDKVASVEMFDRIASRYDRFNRVLSLGQDTRWRRRLTGLVNVPAQGRILDLATGTADVALAILRQRPADWQIVGVDPSEAMLAIGREKCRRAGLADRVNMVQGRAESLAFPDASFDCVTCAFGIRNCPDLAAALSEIARVLKPSGQCLILEFSLPRNAWLRTFHRIVLRTWIRWVGAWVCHDARACRYLQRTVERFLSAEALCRQMQSAGFGDVATEALTAGLVVLYDGRLS